MDYLEKMSLTRLEAMVMCVLILVLEDRGHQEIAYLFALWVIIGYGYTHYKNLTD